MGGTIVYKSHCYKGQLKLCTHPWTNDGADLISGKPGVTSGPKDVLAPRGISYADVYGTYSLELYEGAVSPRFRPSKLCVTAR